MVRRASVRWRSVRTLYAEPLDGVERGGKAYDGGSLKLACQRGEAELSNRWTITRLAASTQLVAWVGQQ